jgi:hypothetical protein
LAAETVEVFLVNVCPQGTVVVVLEQMFTVIVAEAVLWQPVEPVPVTVYVVVDDGVNGVPLVMPPVQL